MPTPPKPKRRRWRYAIGFLLLVIATPFAYYYLAAWLRDRELEAIYRELDDEDPNWRWPDLVAQLPPAPPDEKNAAVHVMKVADLLAATGYQPNPQRVTVNARLSSDVLDKRQTALKMATKNVVEQARRLKDMPEARVPIDVRADFFDDRWPVQKVIKVMHLLRDDVLVSANDQKPKEATESCKAILNAVNAVVDVPTLMALLVSIGAYDGAIDGLEFVLGQCEMSSADLQDVQSALVRFIETNRLDLFLRGERAFAHQLYLKLQSGEISLDKLHPGMNATNIRSRLNLLFLSRWRMRTYPIELRLQNEHVRASKLPDPERIAAFRELEDRLRKTEKEAGSLFSWSYFHGGLQEYHLSNARLRSAIVAVAAERYRLEHKIWPRGMDELVKAGLLKEPLKDPFDGKPLRWKQTDENLIIYSIGEKKIDDGGKLTKLGTRPDGLGFVLWIPQLRHLEPVEAEAPAKKKRK